MNHQYYNVLGVMSGTSLDGVDIAHITLVRNDCWSFQINHTECIPYDNYWRQKLKNSINLSPKKLTQLNLEYTEFLGNLIKDYITKNVSSPLLAVCSHGHTVYHQPELGKTLQIGNLPIIAGIIGERVVCDFRTQDVQLGGQGAPLVPIGDQLLFPEYDYCLNLGGFSNVSLQQEENRIAYDICPVNVVLNKYALMLGKEYDEDGAFAKAGQIQNSELEKLNMLTYYQSPAPKSLGLEWVEEHVFPILDNLDDPNDVLATFTEHAAIQIGTELKGNKKVLVTGGGAYNSFLLDRIRRHSSAELILGDHELIEFKEALIFGLLGVLKLRNQNNCLAAVTGASMDHSSGQIFIP